MIFEAPIPFREALPRQAVKSILPTVMSSAELAQVNPALLERGMFAARVINAEFLQRTSDLIAGILQGKTKVDLPAMDQPTARLELKKLLREIGYAPEPEKAGTIQDLRTDARLNLVLETNTKMAEGYGWWAQGQDEGTLDQYPAQELVRIEDRKERRNWYQRWRAAGGTIYPGNPRGLPLVQGPANEGRCIALKNDEVWTKLSRFGQPYPPFDFNSGVDVRDVGRDEAEELGLIRRDQVVQPEERAFNGELAATPEVRDASLRAALEREGYRFDGDVLMPKPAVI